MIPDTRIDIYNFVYNMFYDVVTKNVYSMNPPQELTDSDTKDGFIVIGVGDLYDESEFSGRAYAWARVFVEAYIPPKSRGRLNKNKYMAFDKSLTSVINNYDERHESTGFSIDLETLLSTDGYYSTSKDLYQVIAKSFVVYMNDSVDASYLGDLYIGLGNSELTDEESITNLRNAQHYNVDIPVGSYVIAFPDTEYLWLCTTNEINKVLSSEIEVPIEEPILIGRFNCYRSSNAIIEGTMEFQII